jgi:precorrin-6B methylase 2
VRRGNGATDQDLRDENSPFYAILRRLYDPVRSFLPRKFASYGGVPVRDRGLFDRHDVRAYKLAGQELIADTVHPTDHVVDIGTGHGAFAVRAAWQGSEVTIDAYEGAGSMVRKARETAEASFVSDRVTVHHAIVGEPNDLFGEPDGADVVDPAALDPCDVLITDCEGAERSILEAMSIEPRELVIESHPEHGSAPETIREILHRKGYETRTVTGDRTFVHGIDQTEA